MPYSDKEVRRDFHRQYMRRYRKIASVKEKEKQAQADYRARSGDKNKERNYKWRAKNPQQWKEIKRRSERRRWQSKKSGYEGVRIVNTVMEAFYAFRDMLTSITGTEHHVDHIIPLSKGGLHVPWNLQVLRWDENLKKGNKLVGKHSAPSL